MERRGPETREPGQDPGTRGRAKGMARYPSPEPGSDQDPDPGPGTRASNQSETQQAGTTGQALPGLNERMHEFTFVDKAGQRPGTNALFDKVSEDIQDRGIALNA